MRVLRAASAAGTLIALALAFLGPFRVIAVAAVAGAAVGLLLRAVIPRHRH